MAAANEGKILVVVDVAELAHKPMSTRSPAGDRPITATLARVRDVAAGAGQGEASVHGHRADFDRERAQADQLNGAVVGSRVRGRIRLSSRQADAGLVCVAAGVRLLPFAPVDWVYVADAAPILLATDFQATRHRQIIEQVRHRVFCPIIAD